MGIIVNKLKFVSSICSLFSGDPNSFVMGHIFEGKFDGSLFAFGESFHLEPAERYFHFKTPFHSVIFPASSVQFNQYQKKKRIVRVRHLALRLLSKGRTKHRCVILNRISCSSLSQTQNSRLKHQKRLKHVNVVFIFLQKKKIIIVSSRKESSVFTPVRSAGGIVFQRLNL